MQEFKDYLLLEYKPLTQNLAATKFEFTHSSKTKIDKKTNIVLIINTIHVNIKFFDKDMNTLLTKSISFENNVLSPSCKKALINIAPAELENRFNAALCDISNIIMRTYIEQLESLDVKIKSLNKYVGADNGVTPIPHTAAVYINKPEKVIKPQIKQMVTRSKAKQEIKPEIKQMITRSKAKKEIKPEIKQMVTRTKAGELNRISYDYNKHNKPKGKINKRGRGRK